MAMTLRLDQKEEKALETLKEFFGDSTAAASIKRAILNYQALNDQLKAVSQKYEALLHERNTLKQGVQGYLEAQSTLNDLAYGDLWHKEIERRVSAYEAGGTTGLSREAFDAKLKSLK